MGNPYPAEIIDSNGHVRAGVEIDFTDGNNQPGVSYTAPITRQQLTGDVVNIANGAGGVLTWDHAFGPDVLLDRSDPAVPAIITAGVYCVAVEVVGAGLTAGGNFNVNLEVDRDNEDSSMQGTSAPSVVGNTSPRLVVTQTYYIGAGGTIRVTATNEDGAAARDFSLVATIQRVS